MKFTTLFFWVLLIATLVMYCSGCSTPPDCSVCCPVCEECSEGVEDPYKCSKYYADKENLEIQIGSFDFFLEGDRPASLRPAQGSDPLVATKCLTCGIHFTHPSYGEHIKTCCP